MSKKSWSKAPHRLLVIDGELKLTHRADWHLKREGRITRSLTDPEWDHLRECSRPLRKEMTPERLAVLATSQQRLNDWKDGK